MAKPKIGSKRTDDYYIYTFGEKVNNRDGTQCPSGIDGWGVELKKISKDC